MAAPDNTDQSGGYRAGYSQPRQERITLPGIREIIPELEPRSSSQGTNSSRVPSSVASPGAWSHSDAATTAPSHYTYELPEQPLPFDQVRSTRERVEQWRREQGHTVPRRYPTSPSQTRPPPISPPFNGHSSVDRHGRYDGRMGSWDGGYSQDAYPSWRHGHGSYGSQGSYSQGGYEAHNGFGYGMQSSDGTRTPNGYSRSGELTPTTAYGTPGEGSVVGPSGERQQRGRKRAASDEEPEDAPRERRNFSDETVTILKRWVVKKIDHLHFTNEEKAEIAREAKLEIKQVDDWFTNYRRRGYPQYRYDYHEASLASVEAALNEAVKEACRAAELGEEARQAAAAVVADLVDRKDEIRDRQRKALEALEDHKIKQNGGKGRLKER